MNQKNDESQGFALLTVFSIVGLVVAAAVGFGSMKQGASFGQSSLEAPTSAALADAQAPRIYFGMADASLPEDANEALTLVADQARADAQVRVRVVPFHDATGDVAAHSELAGRRAWRVRHALESNGVPPQQIEIAEPVPTAASADPRDARRVEMHVR